MRLKSWTSSSKLFIITVILSIALLTLIGSTTYEQIQQQKEAANRVSQALAVEKLDALRSGMLLEEDDLLKLREEQDRASMQFTPLMTLFLGLFGLLIFAFSFWRINQQRKETKRIQEFLENVLIHTQNIISYFRPVYNDEGEIEDFIIAFTNTAIEPVLHLKPEKIKNKLMSELLPVNFENGIFDELVEAVKTQETRQFKTLFDFQGSKTWFATIATPFDVGVLTTSTDTTLQNKSQHLQRELTERLEKQNLLLLDNRAFLSNIFKSISNVIMHFASVRDASGKIIDFQIRFINDAINKITGDIPAEVKEKRVSEVYPTIFTNGIFEKLVTCVEEDRKMEYETQYKREGKEMWFEATAIKLNDGVTVTTREVTAERKKTEELKTLNNQLAIQNSIFKDAEEVADIGSFVGHLDTKEAWISDNFYRILGHDPNDFDISIEKFETFIHPDDIHIYDQIKQEILGNGTANSHQHRIITKDGAIKYLYVNGQSLTRDGKKLLVGVVQDITKRVKDDAKLLQKNEELERSNAELESFNRVASHDLQEPMRKIQLFISRISDSELDELSEKGRIYFEKVTNAANRMQTLIKYLLAYSRLTKTIDDFENIALEEILDKVLEDLEERIEESGVEITRDQLPVLKGISFQLEQLFNNLISNAIKYRTKAETPKIKIECKKVTKGKVTEEFEKKHKSYYQLRIVDNGIGFDKVHSEEIFGLFKRLHQKEEYSGTGIGLAICKKIVENHGGHITATSAKGQGATFCMYLPA